MPRHTEGFRRGALEPEPPMPVRGVPHGWRDHWDRDDDDPVLVAAVEAMLEQQRLIARFRRPPRHASRKQDARKCVS